MGNRTDFQDALFEALAPILGAPDVRQTAAKGIYGGSLPTWWRDLETEKTEKAAAEKAAADKAAAEKAATEKAAAEKVAAEKATVDTAPTVKATTAAAEEQAAVTSVRVRCRYGGQCKRKSTEHFNEFAHPGDADWTDPDKEAHVPADSSAAACTTSSPAPVPAPKPRPCCRY